MGGAMLAVAAVAAIRQPVRQAQKLSEKAFQALIPKVAAPWREQGAGDLILPPSDQLSEKLYEHLVTRVFEAEDMPPVMFLTAYSSVQQNNVLVHRPEICYPAAGFEIVKNVAQEIKLDGFRPIQARFLVADRADRSEKILYWIRVGDSYATSWANQRLLMAESSLEGYLPDGMLVRMSLIGADEEECKATLVRFANALLDASSDEARKLIFGP